MTKQLFVDVFGSRRSHTINAFYEISHLQYRKIYVFVRFLQTNQNKSEELINGTINQNLRRPLKNQGQERGLGLRGPNAPLSPSLSLLFS